MRNWRLLSPYQFVLFAMSSRVARFIVDRYKLSLKWRLLNDAAKLQRTLGKTPDNR
jgi:hypothetical protein